MMGDFHCVYVLWTIFELCMILFEQEAVDLLFEHTKAQPTQILLLNVKYLKFIQAVFYVDNFGK